MILLLFPIIWRCLCFPENYPQKNYEFLCPRPLIVVTISVLWNSDRDSKKKNGIFRIRFPGIRDRVFRELSQRWSARSMGAYIPIKVIFRIAGNACFIKWDYFLPANTSSDKWMTLFVWETTKKHLNKENNALRVNYDKFLNIFYHRCQMKRKSK